MDNPMTPLSPEAVAQMVDRLKDRRASWLGDGSSPDKLCAEAADMLTTLAAENATLRAELDEAQSELDDYHASDWPIWAKQIYNTLKEFGYRYDHFDGIDLPEDVSEFLRGFPENAASELMEQRDDALQELATLRASEAAALERVKVLEAALRAMHTRAISTRGDQAYREFPRFVEKSSRHALTPTADKEPKT